MNSHELIESRVSSPTANEIDCVADAAGPTIREGLPMDRARDAEFQEQATNVAGESLGGRRVVHRQRLGVDAAIPLKQFPDENRDRVFASDRYEIVNGEIFRVQPPALREDRVIGGAAKRHPVRELETTDLPTSAWSDTERAERAVLGEHEVTLVDRRDRLTAAVGHLDERVTGQAFIESIPRELLHRLPDTLGIRRGGDALAAASDELFELLGHELAVLLANGAAEDVGL